MLNATTIAFIYSISSNASLIAHFALQYYVIENITVEQVVFEICS